MLIEIYLPVIKNGLLDNPSFSLMIFLLKPPLVKEFQLLCLVTRVNGLYNGEESRTGCKLFVYGFMAHIFVCDVLVGGLEHFYFP